MKLNILITGSAGDVCNGVIKSLLKKKKFFQIYTTGTKQNKNTNLVHFIKTSNLFYGKKIYINCLKKIIHDKKINLLIPTIDSEQRVISKIKFNCHVMINKHEEIKKLSDKYNLIQFLKKNKFPVLKSKMLNKKEIKLFQTPYMIKARTGWGSKFNYFIKRKRKISFYNDKFNNKYIIQEYLHGNDYTSSFYINKKKILMVTFLRSLKSGRSIFVKKLNNNDIEYQLKKIVKKTKLKFGNIQFKIRDSKVFVYEINPRLSGTFAVQYKFYNYVLLYINELYKTNYSITTAKKNNFIAYKLKDEWIEKS